MTLRSRPSYPWLLLAVLWCVSFVNQADRAILPSVMPAIRDEFHLDPIHLGLLNSIFLWSYAAAAIFAGWLGDRMARSRVIFWGLIFWSVATASAPLSFSFAMLAALRSVTGGFEALYYPSGTALIADWHGEHRRSFALSLHQTAVYAGPAAGAFGAGLIADHFGWRIPFLVYCLCGLILAVAVGTLVRDPNKDAAPEKCAGSHNFAALAANPVYLLICGSFFCATGATQAIFAWTPTFVHDVLHLDLTGSALYGALPIYLTGFGVVPVSGYLADRLQRRYPLGRISILAIGLLIAALFMIPIALVRQPWQVALCLGLSYAGKGMFDGSIYAAVQGVVEEKSRASAVGILTAMGFLGAGAMPLVIALVSERFGLAAGVAAMSVPYAVGLAFLLAAAWVGSRLRRLPAAEPASEALR